MSKFFDFIDDLEIPKAFKNKYRTLEFHIRRRKKCNCGVSFYDESPRITAKICNNCKLLQINSNAVLSIEEALKSLKRHKTCRLCDGEFIDLSLPAGRFYCDSCSIKYSYDVRERIYKDKQKQGAIDKNFSIKNYSIQIKELNKMYLSDAEIAKKLGLLSNQVTFERRRLGLPKITYDMIRCKNGFRSLSTLTSEELERLIKYDKLEYVEIGQKFGLAKSAVKKLRHQFGVKPKFTGYTEADITDEMHEYIIGHLLGDGFIRVYANRAAASFKLSHELDHEDYTMQSAKILADLHPRIFSEKSRKYGTEFAGLGFITQTYSNLIKYHDLFYKPEFKKHPSDLCKHPDMSIFDNLTYKSLSLWYQDDGSFDQGFPSISLFFTNFDYEEMCRRLTNNFGINFYFVKNPSDIVSLLKIRGSNDRKKFFENISPYIHKKMSYKMPYEYRHKEAYISRDDLSKIFDVFTFKLLQSKAEIDSYILNAAQWIVKQPFPYPSHPELISFIKNRMIDCYPIENILPQQNMIGQTYLDCNFRHRFTASHSGYKSIIDAWSDINIVSKALFALTSYNTPIEIRRLLRRIMEMVNAPGHFRPSAAAAIINTYSPRVIADPFIGWGARAMSSFSCPSVKEYIGIDLQEASVNGVRKMYEDFFGMTKCQPKTFHGDANIILQQFESKFDMILAGPPYYNVENYNGVVQKGTYQDWITSFVKPFSNNCYFSLKRGGILALHIFDTHQYSFIEPFMEHLINFGFTYEKAYIYSKLKKTGRAQYVHIFKNNKT